MAEGPVVVDTGVFGADLSPSSKPLADQYAQLLAGRSILISFVTVAELRFGALRAGWGVRRRTDLEQTIAAAKIVWPGDALAHEYAALRLACHRIGHGLAEKPHEADRWIAATARYVGVPLVSADRVFIDAPGVELLTVSPADSDGRSGRSEK